MTKSIKTSIVNTTSSSMSEQLLFNMELFNSPQKNCYEMSNELDKFFEKYLQKIAPIVQHSSLVRCLSSSFLCEVDSIITPQI
uniref:Uncharacterized protein n=1 Tax=Glossina austeni TaxID=7395 RepID=A0A1A9UCL0_GLOAU